MKILKKTCFIYLIFISVFIAAMAILWLYAKNNHRLYLADQGNAAFAGRDYKKAVKLWKAAIQNDPDNVDLHIRLGKAYWRLAKWKNAEKSMASAISLSPEAPMARIELTRILLIRGNINAARNQAVKLLSISPGNPEVHVLSGDINLFENKIQKALEEYKKALLLSSGETRYLLKLAACLHALKNDKKAETYFNMARQKKNLNAENLIQFADYYNHINDHAGAEDSLLKAIRLEPESINIKMRLADLYILEGQFNKARVVLERILKQDTVNTEAQKAMTDVYISLNLFQKAGKLLRHLKEKKPENDFQLELLQGKFWLYQGRASFAAIHLRSAVELAPGLTMGYYYLALAYLNSGQENLAENSLKSVLMLDPDNHGATLLMAGLLYKKKRYLISMKYLDRLIKKEPEAYEAHLLKGLDLLELGAKQQAALSIMAALTIDPLNPSIWYYLGLVFESKGENTRALDSYGKALTLNPDLAEAAYHYSEILIKTKKNKALNNIIRFLKGKKHTAALYYASARTALALGKNKLAQSYIEKAMKLKKKIPYYLVLTRVRVQISMGHNDKAKKILENYTIHNSSHPDGWISLANYDLKTGFLNRAKQVMEKAKKRLPGSSLILANLAWIYIESGDNINLGLELAKKAYEQRPDDPGTADTLGWAYYKKGNYVQASWIFSEMEKKYSKNWLVFYHLGMTLYKQGKIVRAKKKLNMALTLTDDEKKKDNIVAVLAEITDEQQKGTVESADFSKMNILKPLKLNPFDDKESPAPQWKQKPELN